MADDRTPPERPRMEPEIIPPDRDGRRGEWRPWPGAWSTQPRGSQRIYVARLGPFGFALVMLALALVAAAIFLTIVGAVLIWIPVAIVVVAAAAIYRRFHG